MKMNRVLHTFCALAMAAVTAAAPVSVRADGIASGVTAGAAQDSSLAETASEAEGTPEAEETAKAAETADAAETEDAAETSDASETADAGKTADVEETPADTDPDRRTDSAAVDFAEETGDILDALTTLPEQDTADFTALENRVISARSAFGTLSSEEQTLLAKTVEALNNAEISITNDLIVFGGEVPSGAVSVWNEGMKDRPNSARYTNGVLIADEKENVIRGKAAVQALADGRDFSFAQSVAEGTETYGDEEGLLGANVTTWETHADYAQHFGIDVSQWQKKIDWEAVKDAGVEFAIIRCGYGSNSRDEDGNYIQDDSCFEYNVSECERLGIPYGVYLYSYAQDLSMVRSEADHIKRLLEGRTPALPVYLDMEDKSQAALGADMISNMAEEFVAEITDAGYTAGIYANTRWWDTYLKQAGEDEENGIIEYSRWLAQWNTKVTYEGSFTIWQYTSKGIVNGITGNVDFTYWYGTLKGGGSSANSIRTAVYRLYNKKSGEHLYTLDRNERDTLSASGWNYEGVGWYAPKASNSPVFRVFNPKSGEHVYTTDLHEKEVLTGQYHWNFEGICWYSDDSKTVPVYREFNAGASGGFPHNYTADSHEHEVLTQQYGWNDEGAAWYGVAR